MGYTHYFEKIAPIDSSGEDVRTRFASWAGDVQKLLENLPKEVMYKGKLTQLEICGPEGVGNPIITPVHVAFNGRAAGPLFTGADLALAHESFELMLEGLDHMGEIRYMLEFRRFVNIPFCKTLEKPYDLLVTAALIRLDTYFSSQIWIHSDGFIEDWEPARRLCELVFGKAFLPSAVHKKGARPY